jgi:hypothetical protein
MRWDEMRKYGDGLIIMVQAKRKNTSRNLWEFMGVRDGCCWFKL